MKALKKLPRNATLAQMNARADSLARRVEKEREMSKAKAELARLEAAEKKAKGEKSRR